MYFYTVRRNLPYFQSLPSQNLPKFHLQTLHIKYMICVLQREKKKKKTLKTWGEQICIRYFSSIPGTSSPLLKSPISLFNRIGLGMTANFIVHAEYLKGLNCFKVVFLLFHGLGLFNITRTPVHLRCTQKVTPSAEQNKRKEEIAQTT